MSTSDLYIINQKSVKHFAEFRNGWGSAPKCWNYLAQKYLPSGEKYSMFNDAMNRRIWSLGSDPRVATEDRIALLMTLDNAFVPLGKLREAGEACIKFGANCEDGQTVNHWPAFGEALLRAASEKLSRHARGIGLSCTSVSDPWSDASGDTLAKAWSIFASEELEKTG